MRETVEIVQMDKDTLIEFRKTTKTYLDSLKAKYPDVKRVLDSQESFIKDYEIWRKAKSGVAPWSYETYIQGNITQ